jgi:two-component system, NtrC family, sensor histidine kinase PilS
MSASVISQLQTEGRERELYFFSLFRVFVAFLLALLAFSPIGDMLVEMPQPVLMKITSVIFLLISVGIWLQLRRSAWSVNRQVKLGVFVDLLMAGVVLYSMRGANSGVSLILLFSVAGAALFLSLRWSMGFAIAAASLVMTHYVLGRLNIISETLRIAEPLMFSVTYLAAGIFCYLLARQIRESQSIAERRSAEVANLSELNELIIRRMKTGVLVVDADQRIRLANEAAQKLLGASTLRNRQLGEISSDLNSSLWQWRQGRGEVPKALQLGEQAPELLPRYVALSLASQIFLIFLEDSRVYSGRAEELTLATLGRLSASIAHEIRNPLASISYSAQLLDESDGIAEDDRRLLEIIHSQCQRMNGIVQNILGLARRERSQPQVVELNQFATRFVEDYRNSHPLETDVLKANDDGKPHPAMVDPDQMHQILTVLVHNALTYGRLPGEPARVTLNVRKDIESDTVFVEVMDRGPGIPAAVAERLFTPFFTTSEHGTGLGLYIARQLCEANLCSITLVPIPGGGSCFRISVPPARNWADSDMANKIAG